VLADTDGDQISDTDEVLGRNRDPRIADMPLYGISVGDVRLSLDERLTYEDAQGNTVTSNSTSNITLSQTDTNTRSSSGTRNIEAMIGGTNTTITDPSFVGTGSFIVGAELQIGTESVIASQRAYEQSLAKAKELSLTTTVTREIAGAGIDVDLTIENRGNLAFSISNLEVTVLQRSRESSRRYIPVATLIANSTIISGEPAEFNLGPFTSKRGPILFSSRDVFPQLVDELMQLPSDGLVFEVVNYDITDEYGRFFTFSNQIARDRTGGIIIDYGDGQIERHLIATALQPDSDNLIIEDGVGGFDVVGGFNIDGSPIGIPIDFALQDVMHLTKNATVVDGIVVGTDKKVESYAQGDDVQVIPVGTTGVSVGSIVISAGQDGIIDSDTGGDDTYEFTTGYETSLTCNANSQNAREICSEDSQCVASESGNGSCSGPETLVRLGSQRTGDFDRKWVVLTSRQLPAGAEFSQLMLKPGDDIYFAFVQDLDQDGIFAREEFLSGSIDSNSDKFNNATFGQVDESLCVNGCELSAPKNDSDGIADSKDSDRDGLGDYAEIRVGWKVSADGGQLTQVFPSPRLADSDGDGLLDPQEQDLRSYCERYEDDDQVVLDSRQDGLCRYQSYESVRQNDAIAIIAGLDGVASTLAATGSDDEQLINQDITGLTFSTQIIGPGPNGIIDTLLDGQNEYQSVQSSLRIPPATNPILSDTDVDGIEDFTELTGFKIGLSIRDGGNTISDTRAIGDDIQQAFINGPVLGNGIVVLPGLNGIIDSCLAQPLIVGQFCKGDDFYSEGKEVKTDPLRRDSDNDSVADGRERDLGGDPTNTDDGAEFRDSDQDGLSDTEESVLGWLVNSQLVLSNPSRPDSDFDGLPDFAERLLRTDPNNPDTDGDGIRDFDEVAGKDFEKFYGLDEQFPGFLIDGSSSMQYGTNPVRADTDGDTKSDYEELLVGYRILLVGESTFRQVFTNPLNNDTDMDGLTDNEEWGFSDATNHDTDGDGRSDLLEFKGDTNVLVKDVGVSVHLRGININLIVDDSFNLSDKAELLWFITVQKNSESIALLSSAYDVYQKVVWPMEVKTTVRDGPLQFPKPFPVTIPNRCNSIWDVPMGVGESTAFVLDKKENVTLEEGDTMTVRGIVAELDNASDDCGIIPNFIPTWVDSGCVTRFGETFSFEDFQDGGQATFTRPDGTGTTEKCDWEVDLEIRGQ
jgi:hypothetical protein